MIDGEPVATVDRNARQAATRRADLDARPPRLSPHAEAWLATLASAETRRAYRRDTTFLLRRLGLMTDASLAALDRPDAVRYRDLLQALVSAGDCSAGLAGRRMAAALSLYDHLQQQYLVLLNPFATLRRPRQDGGEGRAPRRRPACGRVGCPLAVPVTADAASSRAPRRRSRVVADEPLQLKLW